MNTGVYKHYKGGYYTVLMYGMSANNGDDRDTVVIYVSHTTGQIYTRRASEFFGLNRSGVVRFCYEGPHLGTVKV